MPLSSALRLPLRGLLGGSLPSIVTIACSYPILRLETKHGRGNQIEGSFNPKDKVVVIEDLISTGMSSIGAVRALKAHQVEVLGMVAIFSYLFDIAQENFSQENITLDTLSQYDALLEEAKDRDYISQQEIETLAKWRLAPDKWN